MFKRLSIGFLISLASFSVAAETIVSESPAEIAVTIYRDDLALISEKRIVELPAGNSTIAFEGVNNRMIPQSAILQEFGAITIERNFDFDLMSPAAFFEKSVGEKVLLTRTNTATGRVTQQEATVISGSAGVILDVDGQYEAYQCSGLPESIDFFAIPENLKPKPTLSINITAETAGPQEMTISYLASGFEWQADYVLSLKDNDKADLLGWLTLTNGTSISIEEANTAIIAGSLQVLPETEAEEIYSSSFSARCWPMATTKTQGPRDNVRQRRMSRKEAMPAPMVAMESAFLGEADMVVVTGARIAEREDLGDYKLYRTPQPTTVAALQTKQVMFLDTDNVDVEKTYVFDVATNSLFGDSQTMAAVEYRLDNSAKGTLAQPLPAGTFRVMTETSSGKPFYLGEDDQDDLAVGLPVKIEASHAADVQMETTLLADNNRDRSDTTEYFATIQHRFTNASPTPASIEVTLGKDFHAAIKVDRETKRLVKSESIPTWRFTLKPESSTMLVYRARWSE